MTGSTISKIPQVKAMVQTKYEYDFGIFTDYGSNFGNCFWTEPGQN